MDSVINIAKELIAKDEIEVVIGYEKGRAPFQMVPFFAKTPEDCEKLMINPLCLHNLASYVRDYKGKVALFAKPCDAKALIALLQEHQIEREKVHIVGISCPGVLNPKKLIMALKGKKIDNWTIKGDKIVIEAEGKSEELPMKDFMMNKCISCSDRKPFIFDQIIGDEVKLQDVPDIYGRVKELEKLTDEERQKYWNDHFSRCIRCYACVKTCPLCYCEKCFVESSEPQWVKKTSYPEGNKMFHIMRTFHLAGRCIGCGECDRACPMDIPLGEMNMKMRQSVEENFEYVAGKDPDAIPPLSNFKKEDPQHFIR